MIERRTPLRRSTKPLKRSAVKRSSTSKRARAGERLASWCEAGTHVCTGRAVHRHHKRGRGKPGDDEREHTIDVCDSCHRYIHANPSLSYERGWLERRVST